MRVPGSQDCVPLLQFEEIRHRLRLGTFWDIGRQEIAVADVIGSVGRADEFDGCFRPRTPRLRKVLEQIRAGRPNAADMPIKVYQVDHGYFVEDGHKRLSLAIDEGRVYIDAEVRRYGSRFHLARGATIDQVRATHEESTFRQITALDRAVPEARFELADPDAYLELAESVKAHAFDLSIDRGEVVPPIEAARHWYELVFVPVVQIARDAGVARLLKSCSDAELYLLTRRGITEPFEPGWKVPSTAIERGTRNVRAAEPGRITAALRTVRPARPRPTVLPDRSGHEPES
jgi:hypothetical protein